MANRSWFETKGAELSRPLFEQLALTGLVTLFGILSAGCAALSGRAPSPATSQRVATSVATATTLADLRERPQNLPAIGAGGACPGTSSHDLHPVINAVKGGPGFGFGPGPAYISGIDEFYPSGFDNVVWLVDSSYSGPVLVRGRQVNGAGDIGFAEPIAFPGQGFSSAGSPPPGQPLARVPIEATSTPFYQELDLPAAQAGDAQHFWRMFFSRTHIESAGCYAFQLDGLSFSVVIVFQVPDAARPAG